MDSGPPVETVETDGSALAALGAELQRNAGPIAETVLAWWLENRQGPEPPDQRVCNDILRNVELASVAAGRFMISGALPSDKERDAFAAPGKNAMHDYITVDELTKLYLVTRDVTCRELAGYARRLGVGKEALKAAQGVVRVGSDSAIVGVVRSFDAARRRLQNQLAAERGLLAHQAVHDALTGLPNRTLLMDRLERLLAGSGPAARR